MGAYGLRRLRRALCRHLRIDRSLASPATITAFVDFSVNQQTPMLIPQFTIRRMFWLVTALGVLFAIMALAFRGFFLARSLVGVIGMLAVCFAVFALVYLAAAVWGRMFPQRAPVVDSPFARHSMPPRYVAPENE